MMLAHFSHGTARYRHETAYQRLDENLRVPATGKYVQIKHWIDLRASDNVKAFPEVIDKNCGLVTKDPQGIEYDYVELKDHWQWFLWYFWKWASQNKLPKGKIEGFYTKPANFRTFARTTPGSLSDVYRDMVEAHRAFTEAGSPEAGSRDAVLGRNLTNKKGYEWLCRPTGGHLAKVLRVVGRYYELEAIDLLKPPPSIDYVVANPHLYFWCTQWSKFGGATRFPQITNANKVHGLPPAGTPSPFFSLGGSVRILRSSCVEMVNGAEWTPYRNV